MLEKVHASSSDFVTARLTVRFIHTRQVYGRGRLSIVDPIFYSRGSRTRSKLQVAIKNRRERGNKIAECLKKGGVYNLRTR